MELRTKILDAALTVFAETGYRGATTRRIAQEAEVNEVTLFRHFGSKDELIHAALHYGVAQEKPLRLPDEPQSPLQELLEWTREHYRRLALRAPMIRVCIGESAERPEMAGCISEGPLQRATELRRYLTRLSEQQGIVDADVDTLTNMLMSAVFTDAVTRPMVEGFYKHAPEDAPERYVRVILRAMGVDEVSDVG